MLHRLILKVTKFQLPPPTRLGTVVEKILGGPSCPPPPCQIELRMTQTGSCYLQILFESSVDNNSSVGEKTYGYRRKTSMLIGLLIVEDTNLRTSHTQFLKKAVSMEGKTPKIKSCFKKST